MVNRDAFSGYHPLINFLYFGLVLIFSMVFMHPACLIISLAGAFSYSLYLHGPRALRINLLYMLPVLFITALVNPAFNHRGATVLTYLASGNPLTLESIVYGVAAGIMLIAVICWFYCFSAVVTADKFVYLFGRVIPALALILSMILCFVPKFKAQLKSVTQAQRCLGRDLHYGSVWQRAHQGLSILSIMITWTLENAVETADSMKNRGYGLPGRTTFTLYRWFRRDWYALLFLAACGVYIIIGACLGGLYWRYYPVLQGATGFFTNSVIIVYAVLCLLPLLLDFREDRKWQRLQSTM